MVIDDLIENRESDFKLLCRNHTVKYLYAFGSSVTNKFDFEKSDIDLVVEIEESDPIAKGEKLISFWDKLEEFFKRRVDLLTNLSIRNRILKESIESTKVLIYEQES